MPGKEEERLATIISAFHLLKKYGDKIAVDGIGFSIEAKECFGFLVPSGAGKTTSLRMISCVSSPASMFLFHGDGKYAAKAYYMTGLTQFLAGGGFALAKVWGVPQPPSPPSGGLRYPEPPARIWPMTSRTR